MIEFRTFREEIPYSKLLSEIANFLQGYARGVSYGKSGLKVRTGRLRNSIVAIPEVSKDRILFGTGVIYGRIQELGGEIKPRKARRLWIPLPANLTKAGVVRKKPSDVFKSGFIKKNIFFLKQDKKITPYFVLKDEVKIKPHKYMYMALLNLKTFFPRLVESWVKREKIFSKIIEFHRSKRK
ncbi:MAG: hypothetical protein ABDH28_06570 [Brevinematia bacterium]